MALLKPMSQKRDPSASSGQAIGHPIRGAISDLGRPPVAVRARDRTGLIRGGGGPSGARHGPDGASGDLFEAAQGFVDGLGVGEGVEQVGCDEDDVGSGLHAVVVFAAHRLAEVEMPRLKRISLGCEITSDF